MDPSAKTTAEKPHARGATVARIGAVVVIALALAAAGWHLVAWSAYRHTYDGSSSPLATRAAYAAKAARLEPFNRSFATRDLVFRMWVRGKKLLEEGDYEDAIKALDIAYRNDIGDAELLALYHEAQDVQSEATNRKAHLQHGHEGPGGTLTPDQLER